MIDLTGFDKEGVTDFSDRAYIQHTNNVGGITGAALVISSQNDNTDGIAFITHADSQLMHNSNIIYDAGNFAAPSVPTLLVLTEFSDYVEVEFDVTNANDNATSYEV